jgi:hypothetical protein
MKVDSFMQVSVCGYLLRVEADRGAPRDQAANCMAVQ